TGCGLILGIDDFTDAADGGSGGSTGGTTQGGTGGTSQGGGGTGGTSQGGGGTGGTAQGGGGTGGTGGTGGGMICTPGESVDCYEGPNGTEGVGVCKKGQQKCNLEGTGFDACKGQTLPGNFEDCTTPEDDDCDGFSLAENGCCTPNTALTCYTGPAGTAGVGQCKSSTTQCPATGILPDLMNPNLCVGQVVPADEFCGAPEDEDCNGFNCWVWSFPKGGFGNEYSTAVDTAGFSNKAVFSGWFKGSLDMGGGFMNSQGNDWGDVYLAVYNPDGSFGWSKQLSGDASEVINDVSFHNTNGVLAAGYYLFGNFDPGGGALGISQGFDGFVARYDTSGNHIFSLGYGGGNNQKVWGTEWVFDGYLVAGEFDSDSVFVGSGNTHPIAKVGGSDIFLVKYDGANQVKWKLNLGGSGDEGMFGSGSLGGDYVGGAAYVVGTTSTPGFDIGTGPLAAGQTFFLAKIDLNGAPVWMKGADVGGFSFKVAQGLSGPIVAGTLTAPSNFNGTVLTPDAQDIVVVAYNSSGTVLWQKQFGGPGNDGLTAFTATTDGAWIAGAYDEPFMLGNTMLPTPGTPKAGSFVAKLNSSGNVQWVHALGGTVDSLAVDGAGYSLLAGSFSQTADFGGGAVTPVGSNDVILGKLGR
ncbi:MAG: hypothetical protein R3F14_25985, partial [Polyangiaceae bacterium]